MLVARDCLEVFIQLAYSRWRSTIDKALIPGDDLRDPSNAPAMAGLQSDR